MSKRELRRDMLDVSNEIVKMNNSIKSAKVFIPLGIVGGVAMVIIGNVFSMIIIMMYGIVVGFGVVILYFKALSFPEKLEKLEDEYNKISDKLDNM